MASLTILSILAIMCGTSYGVSYSYTEDLCAKDAPFRALVQKAGSAALDMINTLANQNKTHLAKEDLGSDYDYFTAVEILQSIFSNSAILFEIAANGNTSFYSQCLVIARRAVRNIDFFIQHADDVVPGYPPYTGDAQLQNLMEVYAHDFIAMLAVQNETLYPTTKYQGVIRELSDTYSSPQGLRALIANNDNGPNCIKTVNLYAHALYSVTASVFDNSTDCMYNPL